MLRGAHAPVGLELPVSRVALQQSNEGYPLDDLIVHVDGGDQAPRIQIQVKRNIPVTGQNAELVKVMAAAVEVCRNQASELSDGSVLMGLAAAAPADDLAELAELTAMARAHADHGGLLRLLREGVTRRGLRTRYGHVAEAVGTSADVTGEARDRLSHQILSALHVWHVLAEPDGRDWRNELDGLSELAVASGQSATTVMEHLCGLAAEFGPRSGVIDAEHLRRELYRRYDLRLSLPGPSASQQTRGVNVVNSGSGTVIAGEYQVFNNLRIGN
jgi:hypothetical protein